MKSLYFFSIRTIFLLVAFFGLLGVATDLRAIGDPVDGFAPEVDNGSVDIVIELDSGQILIAGTFTQVEGVNRGRIARLNTDGSLDTTFDPQAGGAIAAMLVQPDGKIVIAGSFTDVGGEPRNRVARLNEDGTVDMAFDPNVSSSVLALALEDDGQILIGGTFSTVSADLTARSRIARLNMDGTLDATFDPDADNTVYAIEVQSDGKILVGGTFSDVGSGGIELLARLNANGTADTGFDPDVAGSLIRTIAVETDGGVLFGGTFASVGGASIDNVARVSSSGTVDVGFAPDPNGVVRDIFVQQDGGVLIAGEFSTFGGQMIGRLGKVLSTDVVDTSFNPNLNGNCLSVFEQSDGKILAAGAFTTAGAGDIPRDRVARFTADGSLEQNFDPGADDTVYSLAIQADGQVLVGGSFTMIGGEARNRAARLSPSGEVDTFFNPNADAEVFAFGLDNNGGVIVGGAFTDLDGTARNRLARFSSLGTLDNGFDPDVSDTVYAVAVEADGNILAGGAFLQVGDGPTDRNRMARFDSSGTVDANFDPNVEGGDVFAIALEDDGSILIGGSFTSVGGVARAGLARVSSAGALDTSFNPGASGDVHSICVQPNGQILVGGDFTTLAGSSATRLGRLDPDGTLDGSFSSSANGPVYSLALQADGNIIVGGDFTTAGGEARNYIAKVDSTGAADVDFDPNADGIVQGVAVRTDGKVLFGGQFANVGGTARSRIAQVTNVGAVRNISLTDSNRTVQLNLGGASPVSDLVEFELSTDGGISWSSLGFATRVSGSADWELVEQDLPQDESVLLRASGRRIGSGNYYGGGSAFQFSKQVFLVQFIRPDLLVGLKRGRMKGDNVYNSSGRGQRVRDRKLRSGRFFLRAENDGNASEAFRLKGKRKSRNARYKYMTLTGGRKNITARVGRGKYVTDEIAPGESVDFLVRVIPRAFRDRNVREVSRPVLFSTANGVIKDRGKTIFIFKKIVLPPLPPAF